MSDIPAGTSASVGAVPSESAAAYPPAAQSNWALFIFALSLVVNFTDRGILNLLVEPIKRDLHLSDIEVSFLMGFAFVAFYVLLGLPIARLVDSKSRRVIIGVGLACWSAMTALCGLAQNFWSFFVFRVGVGVGEACTGPATFSMLSDLFPPNRLPRAIAFMSLGTFTGIGLSMMIGAGIIQMLSGVPDIHVPVLGVIHNWQLVFFIVGLPGLIVAALMFTVIEPKRRGRMTKTADPTKAIPLPQVFKFLFGNWKTYGPMFLALALNTLGGGVQSWGVVFYQRTYGWSAPQAGMTLGIMALITAPLGLLLGTLLVERWHRKKLDDANLRLVAVVSTIAFPFMIVSPLMPTPWLALGLGALGGIIGSMAIAPQNAALQIITPNEMRGQVTALFLFVINVIGTGLGPTFVALFTDLVFHDPQSLRYAMSMAVAFTSPLAVICFWWGLRHYRDSVVRSRSWA